MAKRLSILLTMLILLIVALPQNVGAIDDQATPTRSIDTSNLRITPAQVELNLLSKIVLEEEPNLKVFQSDIVIVGDKLFFLEATLINTDFNLTHVVMYDVSDLANPVRLDSEQTAVFGNGAGDYAPAMTAANGHVYVTGYSGQFHVFSYTNNSLERIEPASANTEFHTLDNISVTNALAIDGDYLYVGAYGTMAPAPLACDDNVVNKYDISDPANISPTPTGTVTAPTGTYPPSNCPELSGVTIDIIPNGNLVYVLLSGENTRFGRVPQGIWSLNSSGSGLLPITLRSMDQPVYGDIDDNGLLHVTSRSRGPDVVWFASELRSYLAANPAGSPVNDVLFACPPNLLSTDCNPGNVGLEFNDVSAENNIVYVGTNEGRLRVFDINGTTPVELAIPETFANIHVEVDNGTLYTAQNSGAAREISIYSTAPSSGTNLLENPSFENGLSSWEDYGNNAISSDATNGSQAICTGTGSGGVGQNVPVTPGTTYRFSGQAKVASGMSGVVGMQFFDADFTTVGRPTLNITASSYAPFAVEMMAPPTASIVKVWTWTDGGSGLFCVDDLNISGDSDGGTGGGQPAACNTTRGLLFETFSNIDGNKIDALTSAASYPNSPTGSSQITNFEIPVNVAERYGVRVRGYITPPETGTYTFWIASDDEGQFFLSSDESVSNAALVARVPEWTPSRTWDWYAEQQSAEITLQAGETYYVEALMKEFFGGDNLEIAWRLPSSTQNVAPQVIPNDYLCTLEQAGLAPNAGFVASTYSGTAPLPVTFDASGSFDPDGNIVSYTWDFGDGNTGSGVNASNTFAGAGNYQVMLTVTDNDGNSSTDTQIVSVTGGNGSSCTTAGMLWELWEPVTGTGLAGLLADPAYPNSPTSVQVLTGVLETPSYRGENYGSRLRGLVTAPVTGSYTFWIAADDDGELWLSTDADPANAQRVAYMPPGWAPPREFGWYAEQQSVEITLQAGQEYYIEVLHKEDFGGDNVAVAWSGAVGTRAVIADSFLCPYVAGGGTSTLSVADSTAAANTTSLNYTPLSNTLIGATFPQDLHDDLLQVLLLNPDVRAQLFALHEHLDMLLTTDGTVTPEFIADATAAYNALYAVSSPDLQTWLADVWALLNLNQYAGNDAAFAWNQANRAAMPHQLFLPILD